MEGEEEDDSMAANSELRYISLELMKLAQQSGKTFDQVASEYMENTCKLHSLISGEEESPQQQPNKKGSISKLK